MDIRQAEIVNSLRQAVNFIIEAVGSGRLGFDYAVKEYAQQSQGELAPAFQEYVRAMEMGNESQRDISAEAVPHWEGVRRTALLALANRLNVPEVTRFAQAMIEAQDTHSSVLQALKSQAEQLKGT